MAGVHELMKAGLGTEVVQGSRAAMETKLVEDILTEIARNGPVAYGPPEVGRAVSLGAVETLAILDSVVRQNRSGGLMSAVENARGKVVVISERFEAGMKLEALGGIAALLRFRLPE
jgi:protein pelota